MSDDVLPDPLASEDYCYVTTIGRVTGKHHTIEIWYASRGATIYLLAGGRDRSDWVRNAAQRPDVTVRIGDRSFPGVVRILDRGDEDALARRLLLAKYARPGDTSLDSWGRDALAVAIDLGPVG